jgi:hypothetical protein
MPKRAPAGYSGKTLSEKLGIRAGMCLAAMGAPPGYAGWLAPLPAGVAVVSRASARADVFHCFFQRRRDLEKRIAPLDRVLRDDAALWISWPKKSSGRPTDITEDVLRGVVLPLGLVDVKVCAVDATWSGLKFVRRLRHRRRPSPA